MPQRPEFLYDVGSPFAWLAAERLGSVGLGEARWRPVLLGGIFKATGRSSWALTDRREEGMLEVERRALAYGLGTLRWPEWWPGNYLAAMRACVIAHDEGLGERFAVIVMRRAFRQGEDLGDVGVLVEAAEETGVTGVPRRLDDPAVKSRLRELTDDAVARGVTGVPTVLVGDETFWGDDRLEAAAAAYSGRSG